jgi:hypothetical protein
MYGIVNKAIQELVEQEFGAESWEKIRKRSGIEENYFFSSQPYDDAVTYQLAQAASEELKIELKDVLIAFGEFWVLHTGKMQYGSLMESGGHTLKEFMLNLPNFHSRIALIFPGLVPPEFQITAVKETALQVHYHSKRQGLKYFVYGLLQGLGKLFHTPVTIEIIASRDEGADHEIYQIHW